MDVLIERTKSIGTWYIHTPLKGMDESFFVAGGDEAAAFLVLIPGKFSVTTWPYCSSFEPFPGLVEGIK